MFSGPQSCNQDRYLRMVSNSRRGGERGPFGSHEPSFERQCRLLLSMLSSSPYGAGTGVVGISSSVGFAKISVLIGLTGVCSESDFPTVTCE